MSKSRETDLGIITKIKVTIDSVTDGSGDMSSIPLLLQVLNQIGTLIEQISWNEDDQGCIRNKHGYRSRYQKDGNKLNKEGAKLDFETLAHLKNLSDDAATAKHLAKNSIILSSLQVMRNKAEFILSQEYHSLDVAHQHPISEDDEVGFLRYLSSYTHDKRSIKHLIELLKETTSDWYQSLNVLEATDRYALGYFFAEIGETAKEISEFIKCGNAEHRTITRLLSKLSSYRDEIKTRPYIVSEGAPKHLLQMKLKFDSVQHEMSTLLQSLRDKLDNLSIDQIQTYNNTILVLLCGETSAKGIGGFEQQNTKILETMSKSLAEGTTNWKKRQQTLETEIKAIEDQISVHEAEINEKKEQKARLPIPDSSAQSAIKESVFVSKTAKQNLPQYKYLMHAFLADCPSDSDMPLKVFREALKDQKFLSKHELLPKLKAPFENIDKSITKLLENQKLDPANVSISQLLQIICDSEQSQGDTLSSIDQAIKNMEGTILKKHIQAKDYNALLKQAIQENADINHMLQTLPNSAESTFQHIDKSGLSKFNALLLDVVEATENMHVVYTKLVTAVASNEVIKIPKLIRAEKMIFGVLGQKHKELKKDFKDKMSEVLIQNSILSDDCFEVMQIRHKQLMHNTTSCDEAIVHKSVKNKILPWLKDFKYMTLQFLEQDFVQQNLISSIEPEDQRIKLNFINLSKDEQSIFFQYTKLVALNRFLKSKEAIIAYDHLKAQLSDQYDPELVTEIHWQASLAYRNVGNFEKVIDVLKLVIVAAEKIQDESARAFKLCGAHCDIAIAYTQIDQYEEARNHLHKVWSNTKATPLQLVGANVLLSGIEAILGHTEVSKSLCELTFIKYFDFILDFNPIVAFSLVEHLTSIYLDRFDLESAADCLSFSEELYTKHRADFIMKEGQHAVYYELFLQYNKSRYHLIEVLANTEEYTDQVSKEYEALLSTAACRDSLQYFSNGGGDHIETVLAQAAVLCGRPKEDVVKYINPTTTLLALENIDEFVGIQVLRIKALVLKLQHFERNHSTETIEYQKMHSIMHHEVQETVTMLEHTAIKYFLEDNTTLAKELMKKSILCKVLDDFIVFEMCQLLPEYLNTWINCPVVDFSKLKDYLHHRLDNVELVYFMPAENVVKQYHESRFDTEERKKLVTKYEMNHLSATFLDEGRCTMHIKYDEYNGVMIHSSLDIKDGNFVIRQTKFKLFEDEMIQTFKSNGDRKFHDKDYSAAINEYTSAMSLLAKHEAATSIKTLIAILYNKARTYHASGDIVTAKKQYLEVLSMEPNHAKSWECLGHCYYADLQSKESAMDAFNKALERYGNKKPQRVEKVKAKLLELEQLSGGSDEIINPDVKSTGELLHPPEE